MKTAFKVARTGHLLGPAKISVEDLRTMARQTSNIHGQRGISVKTYGNRIVISGGSSGDSGKKWLSGVWGINSSTRTVQVNSGLLRHGAVDYDIAALEVSCAGGSQIITVRYGRHDSAEYMNPAPTTLLLPDTNYIYVPICRVNFSAGRLTIPDGGIYHRGMIWIPGESP